MSLLIKTQLLHITKVQYCGRLRTLSLSVINKQTGQAVVEALLFLIIIGSTIIAVMWIGRLQNIGLSLSDSSRHQAFRFAHQGLEPLPDLDGMPGDVKWLMRDGSSLVKDNLVTKDLSAVDPYMGLNHKVAGVIPLYKELRLGDQNIWRISSLADIGSKDKVGGRLYEFDKQFLNISRSTAIMAGNGTAENDFAVQKTLASSNSIWQRYYLNSYSAGNLVYGQLSGIDEAWGRALPEWDWLQPWQGDVPQNHLYYRYQP